MGIFNFTANYERLFEIFDCLTLIIKICKESTYPEDLEEIYDILDNYIPEWRNRDWEIH